MKNFIFIASLIFLFSCGKVEEKKKVVAQTSLQLNGLQSTGVNLGSGTQGMQKYLLVTCTNSQATNSQRLTEINKLQSSFQSGPYVNFTIVGVEVSPSQMNTLLQQAAQALSMFSNYPQCPSNILASVPVN